MYFDDDDGILKLGDMAKKMSSSSGNTYFHMFLHYTYHCCCGFFCCTTCVSGQVVDGASECLEVVSKTWRRNSIEIKLSASSGWPIFFAASFGQEWDDIEFNSQHMDRRSSSGWHDIPNKWWWRRWEWMIWYVGHMCDFRSHWPDSSFRICLS